MANLKFSFIRPGNIVPYSRIPKSSDINYVIDSIYFNTSNALYKGAKSRTSIYLGTKTNQQLYLGANKLFP